MIQEVALPVITNKVCETMYRQAGFVEDIPDIFICAGYGEGGKDSCEVSTTTNPLYHLSDRKQNLDLEIHTYLDAVGTVRWILMSSVQIPINK